MKPGDGLPDDLPRRVDAAFGLVSATAIVIGEVIGVGIFLTPSEMARSLGSPFWLLVVWGSMGFMTHLRRPLLRRAGRPVSRGRRGLCLPPEGVRAAMAFLYGWMSLLVTDPGITALMAAGLASYAGSLVPLSPDGAKLVSVGAILALAAANILGLGIGAGLLRGLSVLKLGLLGGPRGLGIRLRARLLVELRPAGSRPPGSEPLAGAIVGGLLAAFFSLAGWWDLNKVAGEVRDPGRTMPRALILGMAFVTLAYILVSAVFWYLVPLSQVDTARGFAAQAGEALFGAAGGRIFASIVILSVLGSLAGLLMTAPRVYVAMARDGLFPSALAAIHPRFGTPARATALQAIVASILVISGSFEQILSYFMAVTIAFLALIAAVVYILPAASGPGRVPGHPVTPLGFLIPVAAVVLLQVVNDPVRTGLGLGIVALGLPVYEISSDATPHHRAWREGPLSLRLRRLYRIWRRPGHRRLRAGCERPCYGSIPVPHLPAALANGCTVPAMRAGKMNPG